MRGWTLPTATVLEADARRASSWGLVPKGIFAGRVVESDTHLLKFSQDRPYMPLSRRRRNISGGALRGHLALPTLSMVGDLVWQRGHQTQRTHSSQNPGVCSC